MKTMKNHDDIYQISSQQVAVADFATTRTTTSPDVSSSSSATVLQEEQQEQPTNNDFDDRNVSWC